MKQLGVDLLQLVAEASAEPPSVPACPGAALRIDRATYREMRHGGESFLPGEDIPTNALGTVRVRCSNVVAQIPKTAAGHVQYYGLCHSCSGLEANNRQWLRARAGAK